jgi:putative transposase
LSVTHRTRKDISMKQRVFYSNADRDRILKEVETEGFALTLRKYGLTARTMYRWRARLQSSTNMGAKPEKKSGRDLELRKLQSEVQQLKALVAEKELALRVKDALLKKTQSRDRIE